MEYMEAALIEARLAFDEHEVPVGAVVVHEGRIIAQARNKKEQNHDLTAHAEILAMREAGKALGKTNLKDCQIYITLEPCPMCLSAIIQANIRTLCFGAYDRTMGAVESYMKIKEFPDGNRIEVVGGILEKECGSLLQDFFRTLR